MKTQFEQMIDGLNDVEAFFAGDQEGFKAHVPQEVDVKAIRNRLGMTELNGDWGLNWGLRPVSCTNLQVLRCHPCACKLFGINFPLNS
jgi:hypothetical protein